MEDDVLLTEAVEQNENSEGTLENIKTSKIQKHKR